MAAKTTASRLVVLRRPPARATRRPPAELRDLRPGDWGWVSASRKKLVSEALAGLGARQKLNLLGAPFTLTSSKPAAGDRAYLTGRMVGWFTADPEDAVFWFSDVVNPERDWDRFIAVFGLLPPHCAALIDMPIVRDSGTVSLRVEAWNTTKDGAPGMTMIADQTTTFEQGLPNPVHLGVVLPDVGAANTGSAAGVRVIIYVKMNSATFRFPSITVTPL